MPDRATRPRARRYTQRAEAMLPYAHDAAYLATTRATINAVAARTRPRRDPTILAARAGGPDGDAGDADGDAGDGADDDGASSVVTMLTSEDTQCSAGSWAAALAAAGSVLLAVDAVAHGRAANALCAVRGHRAARGIMEHRGDVASC